MKRLLTSLFCALALVSAPAAAQLKPLVIRSGQTGQVKPGEVLVDGDGYSINAGPIRTKAPDGVAVFLSYTTTGASNCFTASGGTFTSADVGKYITVKGIGAASTEWTFTSTISSVAGASSICTAATPPRALTSFSALTYYGTDQTSNIQAAFTAGAATKRGSYVTGGIYLVASPLTCMPPALPGNNTTASPALCSFDQGSHLIFVGSNPASGAFVTFGSTDSDYRGYLREAVVHGGTIDCNHICGVAESFPFFKHLKRYGQKTKNALWAGVRYNDSATAPTASGGIVDRDNDYEWDFSSLTISNITSAAQPVVTTTQPHGISSPRFVSIIGANNIPNGVPLTFWATVNNSTQLLLHNVNGSGWVAFSGTAYLNLALPAYRPLTAFSSATAATPPVVNTDGTNSTSGTGGFIQNGDQIEVYNVASTGGAYDGTYTACALAGSGGDGNWQLSLYQAGGCSTAIVGNAITVTGAGWLYKKYELVSGHPENAGVWLDNATDAEFHANTINGTVVGVYSPAGYDQKWVANHNWNYPQHGPMLFSGILGGDNSLIGEQQDCPAWNGYKFTAANNSIVASEVNCAGFNSNADSKYTWLRIDSGASVGVWGGRIKGQSSPTARPQFEVSNSAVAGTPSQTGGHPNYKRFGLETSNTIFTVSDTYRWSLTGSTTAAQAQATTRYLGPNGAQAAAANSTWLATNYGRAVRMDIQTTTTPAAGQTFTFTAQNGGTNLGSCTITNGNFSCTATLSGTISLGNNLYIQSVFSATSGSADIRYSINFEG